MHTTRIGRQPNNDIIIADLDVSKQHAELRRSPGGRYSITDLGSHNGTYVNGTRVNQAKLTEGDILSSGHSTLGSDDVDAGVQAAARTTGSPTRARPAGGRSCCS